MPLRTKLTNTASMIIANLLYIINFVAYLYTVLYVNIIMFAMMASKWSVL